MTHLSKKEIRCVVTRLNLDFDTTRFVRDSWQLCMLISGRVISVILIQTRSYARLASVECHTHQSIAGWVCNYLCESIDHSISRNCCIRFSFSLLCWWTRRCSAHVRKIRRMKRCWQSWLTDRNSANLLSHSVLLRHTQKLFNLLNKIKYRFHCDYTAHASLRRCP